LRRRGFLTRCIALRDRSLFDRPHGLTVGPIKNKSERLLRQLNDGIDRLAIDRDVGKDRGGRHVVLPGGWMGQLIMPDAFAGPDIEANERRGKQVVSRTLSSILIAGRAFNRNICIAQLLIDCERSPGSGVSRIEIRSVLPCVFAELTFAWD